MNKKFLIFSGVGDNENQFISWAGNRSDIYDRAFFYYGSDPIRKNELTSMEPEYFFELKGMIWENFCKLYKDFFSSYEYVLIVDSDLHVPQKNIENTFIFFDKKQYYAGTWSRSGKDFGHFVPFFSINKKKRPVSKSNFIEMLFMLVKKELIELTIEKWSELNLKYSTGIDIVLSNVANNNGMLPFVVLNFYEIYNPHPEEKLQGRELDRVNEIEFGYFDRFDKLNQVLENDEYFKLIYTFQIDDYEIHR